MSDQLLVSDVFEKEEDENAHLCVAVVVGVVGVDFTVGFEISTALIDEGIFVIATTDSSSKEWVISQMFENNGISGHKFNIQECDITSEKSVKKFFEWLSGQDFGRHGIDLLINYYEGPTSFSILDVPSEDDDEDDCDTVKNPSTEDVHPDCKDDGDTDDGDSSERIDDIILRPNIEGVIRFANHAARLMLKDEQRTLGRKRHIFNICSMLGQTMTDLPDHTGCVNANVYSATQSAINAFTQGLRKELVAYQSTIRVTAIIVGRMLDQDKESDTTLTEEDLQPSEEEGDDSRLDYVIAEDVVDAIFYAYSTPQHCMVHDVQLQPASLGLKTDRMGLKSFTKHRPNFDVENSSDDSSLQGPTRPCSPGLQTIVENRIFSLLQRSSTQKTERISNTASQSTPPEHHSEPPTSNPSPSKKSKSNEEIQLLSPEGVLLPTVTPTPVKTSKKVLASSSNSGASQDTTSVFV